MENLSNGKKERVGRMFDSIAPTYDLLNHLLSLGIDRGWRRKVVEMVKKAVSRACPSAKADGNELSGNPSHRGLKPTEMETGRLSKVLDVATGTGDLAIALARAIPSVRVTGIDISERMLAEGRRKVADKGLEEQIVLQTGDAEKSEFGDAEFDVVTVAFGVRNFGDVEAGLREMERVLRPGGSCFVLEFSEPRGVIFGNVYRFYFHKVLPLAGRIVSRDRGAYDYLPRSVADFPSPERFAEMLKEAGFAAVRTRRLTGGVAYIYDAKK